MRVIPSSTQRPGVDATLSASRVYQCNLTELLGSDAAIVVAGRAASAGVGQEIEWAARAAMPILCSCDPFPGLPVPMHGIHRAKAEQLAECSWAPLVPGLTPHGLRHGHQTAMRRDRVPRVLRRDRLGHGRSADIADHYTHIDDETIGDMLACLTRRWQGAVTKRARIDVSRGAEPRSAVPVLDEWLALFRERSGEIKLPLALPLARKRGGE